MRIARIFIYDSPARRGSRRTEISMKDSETTIADQRAGDRGLIPALFKSRVPPPCD